MRAAYMGVVGATALLGLNCTEGRVPTGPVGLHPGPVRLSMHAVVGSSGHALQVLARYARAAAPGSLIPLDSTTVALNAEDSQVSVQINVMPCLNDEGRELPKDASSASAATTCVLHLTATLLNAKNQVIDQATLPPLPAEPSMPVTAPEISLGVSLGKLTLSPRETTINAIGYAVDLAVTAIDKQGEPMARPAMQFTSSDTTVATVDSVTGHVIARAVGVTRVVVASHEQRDTATVTVRQVPGAVALHGVSGALFSGDTALVQAEVRDSGGTVIPPAAAAVQFSSSDSTLARIDAHTGVVQALGQGTVILRGVAGPASATMNVPVSAGVIFAYCSSQSEPVWVAYQQGTNGPWQRVDGGMTRTYRFRISDKGAIARVMQLGSAGAGGYQTFVTYGTVGELQSYGVRGCPSTAILPTVYKSFSGTVTGLSSGERSSIWFTNSTTQVTMNGGSFSFYQVIDGPHDLIATKLIGADQRARTIIVRRGLNPPDGSTIPVLDFASAEAFALDSAHVTISNLNGRSGGVRSSLVTSAGYGSDLGYAPTTNGVAPYSGIPTSHTAAGDRLIINATANDANGAEYIYQDFSSDVTDHSVAVGPLMSTPSISILSSSPIILTQASVPSQPEYGDSFQFQLQQGSASSARFYQAVVSAAYLGGTPATWVLAQPAWPASSGYEPAWGISTSTPTSWSTFVTAYTGALIQQQGGPYYRGAYRTGTLSQGAAPIRIFGAAAEISRRGPPAPALPPTACAPLSVRRSLTCSR